MGLSSIMDPGMRVYPKEHRALPREEWLIGTVLSPETAAEWAHREPSFLTVPIVVVEWPASIPVYELEPHLGNADTEHEFLDVRISGNTFEFCFFGESSTLENAGLPEPEIVAKGFGGQARFLLTDEEFETLLDRLWNQLDFLAGGMDGNPAR